jgi:hypothetical protein
MYRGYLTTLMNTPPSNYPKNLNKLRQLSSNLLLVLKYAPGPAAARGRNTLWGTNNEQFIEEQDLFASDWPYRIIHKHENARPFCFQAPHPLMVRKARRISEFRHVNRYILQFIIHELIHAQHHNVPLEYAVISGRVAAQMIETFDSTIYVEHRAKMCSVMCDHLDRFYVGESVAEKDLWCLSQLTLYDGWRIHSTVKDVSFDMMECSLILVLLGISCSILRGISEYFTANNIIHKSSVAQFRSILIRPRTYILEARRN